jgi:hypothetical protein
MIVLLAKWIAISGGIFAQNVAPRQSGVEYLSRAGHRGGQKGNLGYREHIVGSGKGPCLTDAAR